MKKLLLAVLCVLLVMSLCSCDFLDRFLITPNTESSSSSSESEAQTPSSSEKEQQSEIEIEESSESEQSSSGKNDDLSDATSEESSSEEIIETHTHSFTDEVFEPSCVERGYTMHTCECGYTFADTFVEEIGEHSFERGICTVCEEIDYPDLINIISTETIKANITVKTEYSNKAFGFGTQIVGISTGSGVIIKHTDTEYYALTNNHVVYSDSLEASTQYTSYYVIDYIGTQYQADCIANMPEYDLAIVKFTSTESYTVLSLEAVNSEEDDFVISLGQPEGQSNTITLGNVVGYSKVTLKDSKATESNVTFEVLQHDAYINSGSSGGALLDAQLNVIGINYAGAIDENGNSVASYAIPVEKVYSFFDEVGFAYNESTDDEKAEDSTGDVIDETTVPVNDNVA